MTLFYKCIFVQIDTFAKNVDGLALKYCFFLLLLYYMRLKMLIIYFNSKNVFRERLNIMISLIILKTRKLVQAFFSSNKTKYSIELLVFVW